MHIDTRGGRVWIGVMLPGRVIATKVTKGDKGREGEGAKKSEFWGDVIYGWSLM